MSKPSEPGSNGIVTGTYLLTASRTPSLSTKSHITSIRRTTSSARPGFLSVTNNPPSQRIFLLVWMRKAKRCTPQDPCWQQRACSETFHHPRSGRSPAVGRIVHPLTPRRQSSRCSVGYRTSPRCSPHWCPSRSTAAAGSSRRRSTASASLPSRTAPTCSVNRFLRPGRGWVLGSTRLGRHREPRSHRRPCSCCPAGVGCQERRRQASLDSQASGRHADTGHESVRDTPAPGADKSRSEERRVGKECRS